MNLLNKISEQIILLEINFQTLTKYSKKYFKFLNLLLLRVIGIVSVSQSDIDLQTMESFIVTYRKYDKIKDALILTL